MCNFTNALGWWYESIKHFTESFSCKISKEHFHDYDTRC
jgi:hypothetical protein